MKTMVTKTKSAIAYMVERLAGGYFQVTSPEGRRYMVHPELSTCECADYLYRAEKEQRPCKHIRLVKKFIELEKGI